jgi:hypothetical protein
VTGPIQREPNDRASHRFPAAGGLAFLHGVHPFRSRPGARFSAARRGSRDPFSAKPYVLFKTTKRVGGGVQDFHAIKLLKFAA